MHQHMCELCTVWPSSYSDSDSLPLQHTPYALLYILNFLNLNFRLMYSTKLNISLPHMTMTGMSNVSVHREDQ